MKPFLKTLIGGALGVGALYLVGKTCYRLGKEVAEIEQQLETKAELDKRPDPEDTEKSGEEQLDNDPDDSGESEDPADRVCEEAKHKIKDAIDEAWEKNTKKSVIGRTLDKIRNAKMFVRVKNLFDRKGERSPGILGSLLQNPDGAKIEAFVHNGCVRINVTPRSA